MLPTITLSLPALSFRMHGSFPEGMWMTTETPLQEDGRDFLENQWVS